MNINNTFDRLIKNRFLFITLLIAGKLNAQYSPAQSQLSDYYKTANTLQKEDKFELAIQYLDSSLMFHGDDSVELAFNYLLRGQCLGYLNLPDSANTYYHKLEILTRSIEEKEPLSWHLLFKGFNLSRQNEYRAGNKALKECLSIMDSSDFRGPYRMGFCYKILAGNYLSIKKMDSAYQSIKLMTKYAEMDEGKKLLPQTFNTISWYYYKIGDYESALETAKEEFNFYGLSLNEINPNNSILAGNIALNYIQLGDYERAEQHLLAIIKMYQEREQKNMRDYYSTLDNLAYLYVTSFQYGKGLAAIDESLEVYKNLHSDFLTPYLHESLTTKARMLIGLGRFNEADELLNQTISYFETTDDGEIGLMNTHLRAGVEYVYAKLYTKALDHLRIALDLYKLHASTDFKEAVSIYSQMAQATAGTGNVDEALHYLDSGIWYNQKKAYLKPTNTGNVYSAKWQTEMLNQRLLILKKQWIITSDIQVLNEALKTIDNTGFAIDYARKTILGDQSRLSIAEDFYQHAVYFYVESYKKSRKEEDLLIALSYAENNKSFLLNEISNENNLQLGQDFRKLLEVKKEAKKRMLSSNVDGNTEAQFQLYNQLDTIQKQIDSYKLYKYDEKLNRHALEEVKSTLVSFHIGVDELYTFIYRGGNLSVSSSKIGTTFHDQVINLRNALTDPGIEIKNLDFQNELIKKLGSNIPEKMVIIPDGVLNYVPFETMRIGDSDYLANHSSITYMNSIFLDHATRVNKKNVNELISFAPSFNSSSLVTNNLRASLSELPGAKQEVAFLNGLFMGKSYLDDEATESQFLNKTLEYDIIHLATHAIVDDQNPLNSKMVFELAKDTLNDGYLHAYEIYNLNLNAQLVTLSACNTGFGKIRKGEGVMSLSRAFAYAGVPATVVSLWPASDKSTPELMKHFYQNLKDGQDKDVALNNARKQYLATAKGKARHPFYWGGFVLIGDNSPLEEDSNFLVWTIPSVLLIVMILTVYRRKRNRT